MRKQKMLKRVAAAVLAGTMALSLAACGKESGGAGNEPDEDKDLSWLNTGGELPIVKEGTEKTLSLLVCMNVDSPDPEETWVYEFVEKAMGIKLEVQKCLIEDREETISLAFASDELPDIIINGAISTGDLLRYGVEEGQIIDLAPYVNEELMPNLSALYEYDPSWKESVTDSEGHVWSLGYISDPGGNQMVSRMFINYDALEAEGLKVPETLDELTEAARAIKAKDESMYPLGGSYEYYSPMVYILNAFGYITNDALGLTPALRNGEVVLPMADREAFGEVITYMNMLYEEGLIHPDFFTMDTTTTDATMSEGKNIFYAQAPFVFLDTFGDWWGALPLTSEYNDTQVWPTNKSSISCGQFVVTKECEDPELAVAFADWFYETAESTETSHFSVYNVGPNVDNWSEYLYGTSGWYRDETGEKWADDIDENPDLYNSFNDYIYKRVQLWPYASFGAELTPDMTHNYEDDRPIADEILSHYENPADSRHDYESGQIQFETAMHETLCQYTTDEVFPPYVYFDAETQDRINDLQLVLNDYAKTEFAKFVTGARPLSELDAYFDEIEELGATEYVQIYADYYDSIK